LGVSVEVLEVEEVFVGVSSFTFIPFFYKFLSERGFHIFLILSEIANSGALRSVFPL
jgi:hypothetical protein